MAGHFLIVEARFYEDLGDALAEGAISAIEEAGGTFERVEVPGALEIPGQWPWRRHLTITLMVMWRLDVSSAVKQAIMIQSVMNQLEA